AAGPPAQGVPRYHEGPRIPRRRGEDEPRYRRRHGRAGRDAAAGIRELPQGGDREGQGGDRALGAMHDILDIVDERGLSASPPPPSPCAPWAAVRPEPRPPPSATLTT